MRFTILALGLADTPGRFVTRPVESLVLTLDGIPGDRHAGRTRRAGGRDAGVRRGTVLPNERQLSLVSDVELDAIARALGVAHVDWTWLGANLCLGGGPLAPLARATRLVAPDGVTLTLAGENEPCLKAGRVIAAETGRSAAAFVKAAVGLRGLVAWVSVPGTLRRGDQLDAAMQ